MAEWPENIQIIAYTSAISRNTTLSLTHTYVHISVRMNELVITIFRFKFYALIFLLSNYVNVFQFPVLKASEDGVHASIYFYTGASG